jgi:hypothetical protein
VLKVTVGVLAVGTVGKYRRPAEGGGDLKEAQIGTAWMRGPKN